MFVHIITGMDSFSIEYQVGRDLKDYLGQSSLAKAQFCRHDDPVLCSSKP